MRDTAVSIDYAQTIDQAKKEGTSRAEAIRRAREQGATFAQIGDVLDITAERVRQILRNDEKRASDIAAATKKYDDYIARTRLRKREQMLAALHALADHCR